MDPEVSEDLEDLEVLVWGLEGFEILKVLEFDLGLWDLSSVGD